MEYTDLTPSLQAAIVKAENIAIDELQSQRDFQPFILCGDTLDTIERIKTRDEEEMFEIAEELLGDMADSTTAILVYKDNIKLNDGTFEAIVCQLYDMNEDSGYSFGQLYRFGENKIEFLKKRLFLGEIRNLLMF
ncbi:hypothetical protein [Chitinophaga qingshengii]|uniref:Uncharacterized protein n=1 Tax=Chitinophaga qingshengii TaxID=1569794 RepID=A0ABR7TV53_9BACT|nr:hypothetical protein [Chitinophaga qingshengii]MBC9933493.1 hypothetical protein [Chitinophaga qingshengii]